MEEMTDQEICNFVKTSIESLQNQKKEEVMKCVGDFVFNPKIGELNKQITNFQKQCKHLALEGGKCIYCGKQIENLREVK
jgi:hypothetical protein